MFAACVASLRAAEKTYEENNTAFNKRIVIDLQNKVDAWVAWIENVKDEGLAKDVPPFVSRRPYGYKGVVNNDIMKHLMANHTPEEIERYTRLMQGDWKGV